MQAMFSRLDMLHRTVKLIWLAAAEADVPIWHRQAAGIQMVSIRRLSRPRQYWKGSFARSEIKIN